MIYLPFDADERAARGSLISSLRGAAPLSSSPPRPSCPACGGSGRVLGSRGFRVYCRRCAGLGVSRG